MKSMSAEAQDIDVPFDLYSPSHEFRLILTVHMPAGYLPAGDAGGPLWEPWSVNSRVIAMLAANVALRYLEGHSLPPYVTVKSGGPELEAAKGKEYFISQHRVEWSKSPLGLRENRGPLWLEPDPAPAKVANAQWHVLNRQTWQEFWTALEKRYKLNDVFR